MANLSGLSLRSVLKVFSKPEMIPVRLSASKALDPVQAAVQLMPGLLPAQAEAFRTEIASSEWLEVLNASMLGVHGRPFRWSPWNEFVYIVMRTLQPRVMVETGVFDGHASAIELQALERTGMECWFRLIFLPSK